MCLLPLRAFPRTDTVHTITRMTYSRSQRASANDLGKRCRRSTQAQPWRELGQRKPPTKILTRWLVRAYAALALAQAATHFQGLGSRPCFRIPIEGRPIPVAVSRGCARYVRRRPAFATPPALNIDVTGAFPQELKCFSQRVVTENEWYRECWAPLSEHIFAATVKGKVSGMSGATC